MANYHRIIINGPKMTQNVAVDIFQYLSAHNRVREFSFHEGFLNFYVRGYSVLGPLLREHGFNEDDVVTQVIDEFDLMSPVEERQVWTIWEFEN